MINSPWQTEKAELEEKTEQTTLDGWGEVARQVRTKPWLDMQRATTQQGKMAERRQVLPEVSYSPVLLGLGITARHRGLTFHLLEERWDLVVLFFFLER